MLTRSLRSAPVGRLQAMCTTSATAAPTSVPRKLGIKASCRKLQLLIGQAGARAADTFALAAGRPMAATGPEPGSAHRA